MTEAFRYPTDDLDNVEAMLAALGTFWATTFDDALDVESWVFVRAEIEKQTRDDRNEMVNCLSRLTTPVFHQERWFLLRLLESERSK